MGTHPLRIGLILCIIGLGGLILTQVAAAFVLGRNPVVRQPVLPAGVVAPRYPRSLGSL